MHSVAAGGLAFEGDPQAHVGLHPAVVGALEDPEVCLLHTLVDAAHAGDRDAGGEDAGAGVHEMVDRRAAVAVAGDGEPVQVPVMLLREFSDQLQDRLPVGPAVEVHVRGPVQRLGKEHDAPGDDLLCADQLAQAVELAHGVLHAVEVDHDGKFVLRVRVLRFGDVYAVSDGGTVGGGILLQGHHIPAGVFFVEAVC